MSEFQRDPIGNEALLQARLMEAVERNKEDDIATSMSVWHAASDRMLFTHHQNKPHEAASINKLAIIWAVREQGIDLDQTVAWTPAEIRPGNGRFDTPEQKGSFDEPAMEATVRDLVIDTSRNSGNTSPRALVNFTLGGASTVNQMLRQRFDVRYTRLQEQPNNQFLMGYTTSRESLKIVRALLSEEDTEYNTVVKDALSENIFIADGVRSQLAYRDPGILTSKAGILSTADGDEGLARHHDAGGLWRPSSELQLCYVILTSGRIEEQARQSLRASGQAMIQFAGV